MWPRLLSLEELSSRFSFSEEVEVARLAVTFNRKLSEDSEPMGEEEDIPIRVAYSPAHGKLRSKQTLTIFFTMEKKHAGRVSAALVTPDVLADIRPMTMETQDGTITVLMTVPNISPHTPAIATGSTSAVFLGWLGNIRSLFL